MGRRIYLDLGANHGVTIRDYLNRHPQTLVHAFEPNPTLAADLQQQFAPSSSQVHVVAAAAWIYDGEIELYPGAVSDQSSTVLTGKIHIPDWRVDYDAPMRVRCIDFDRWLRENTATDDDVHLKMDIEGAEYRVLERCLESGSLRRIRAARIEWHHDRYPSISKAEHERIRCAVARIFPVEDWI